LSGGAFFYQVLKPSKHTHEMVMSWVVVVDVMMNDPHHESIPYPGRYH
jgi:hypothetical protein